MTPQAQAQMTGALVIEVAGVAGNLGLTPTGVTVENLTFIPPAEVAVQFPGEDITAVDTLAEAFGLREADKRHPCYLRTGTAEVAGWTVKVVVYSGRPAHLPAEVAA